MNQTLDISAMDHFDVDALNTTISSFQHGVGGKSHPMAGNMTAGNQSPLNGQNA